MIFLHSGMNLNSVAQLLTMIIVFVLVLFMAYAASRFAGSLQKSRMTGSNLKIIETVNIGNNQFLQIVNVGKKYILVGICKDSITYLGELDEDDLTIQENSSSDDDFKKILARLRKHDKMEKKDFDQIEDHGKVEKNEEEM